MWIFLGILAFFLLFLGYRFTAVRVIGTLITFVVLLLAGPISTLIAEFSNPLPKDTSILRNYDLAYDLQASGDLSLKEAWTVEFTQSGKHGIFRFFDVDDNQDPSIEHPVDITNIQRCNAAGSNCVKEPYTTYWEDGLYVVKIGSASVTYPRGTTFVYKIDSTTTNAITSVPDQTDAQWYWNVLPQNTMRMEKAEVTATLPASAIPPIQCAIGESSCTVESTGDNSLSMSATNITPGTTGSWLVEMPPDGLTVVEVSGESALDSWGVRGAMIAVGVLVAGWLYWQTNKRKERKPSQAPNFAEPKADFLPAVWTLKESPTDNGFQAMLLKLSDDEVLTIQPEMSGQTVSQNPSWFDITRTQNPTPPDMTGADLVVNGLGVSYPGSTLRVEKKSKDVGKKVQSIEASLKSQSRKQAISKGLAETSTSGVFIHIFAAILAPLGLLSVGLTSQAFPAAMFAIASIGGWWSSWTLGTDITQKGLQVRDEVAGLKVALSTKASIERFDYALRARHFLHFLPWAVALDCADEWAEACKPDDPTRTDDQAYYAYMSSYMMASAISSTVSSVSQSAVSSYSASQSSGGGGGGGFSAGGGGGGGGGGSW